MGSVFSELLDKYPVSPYLDKRESFIKWVHFLHNQINLRLNRDEVSLQDAVNAYYSNYKPKEVRLREEIKYRRKLIYAMVALTTATSMYYLYYA
jgi:flagellar basal body rod protein FlgB